MIPFRTTAEAHGSPAATMGLIVANIAVYLYQADLSEQALQKFIYTFALVPAVFAEPGLARQAGFDADNYWPLITNTFLHAGFLHLIFNIWTLWLFGAPVEGRMGSTRFAIFYLASGAVGSTAHLAFNLDSTIPALGASGAVAGVLGAYALLFPKARVALVQPIFFLPIIFHLPAYVFTGVWFGIQILQGFIQLGQDGGQGGIAWWAHIGGFAAGLGIAWYMRAHRPKRPWR